MPVIEVDVKVSPGLSSPVDLTPYLNAGMPPAVAEVKTSADAALARDFKRRNNWSRRHAKAGYGPLHGSLATFVVEGRKPGDGAAGFVRTDTFYARFLERGAKGHPMSRRGVLPLVEPGGGVHFRHATQTKPIKHPGVRARYWMRGSLAENVPDVIAIFTRETERWARDAEVGLTRGMPG